MRGSATRRACHDRSNVIFTEIETKLRDGTGVLVRPIRPEDKGLLRDLFGRLSEESRRLRFMGAVSELTEEQLKRLTEVDFIDHLAWIAVAQSPPHIALGVARCVRTKEIPDVAEAAITVADAYQNRGLGTLLLAVLGVTAQMVGIKSFRAYVLADNEGMRELLGNVGVKLQFDSPGVLRLEVPIELDRMSDSPAALALKAFASDMTSSLRGREGEPAP
jgi:GNAT superfamily N-acetyltransferase